MKDVVSPAASTELHQTFEVIERFRVTLMQLTKHDFKMAVLDKRTSCFGLVVNCNKWIAKEATVSCMEEMRFLARARNLDEVWGVSTTLYDWQFIHYSKKAELAGDKDFYTLSGIYPCYKKDDN